MATRDENTMIIDKKVNQIIEDIQEAQVCAGGIFTRQKEFREMPVEELLRRLLPNDVKFKIKHVAPHDRNPLTK